MKYRLLTGLFLSLACVVSVAYAGDLPNPIMTPGAINPEITQGNISSTVCVKGFTKTIRPPTNYTNRLKKEQIRLYGYQDTNPKDYEEDHLIPLSIGGNPTDERNLWPQPRNSEWNADKKDHLELVIMHMVCHKEISLNQAQHEISTDWIATWKKYVPSHPAIRPFGEKY